MNAANSVNPSSYSLNEMQALSLKAARGVGLAWGICEEAAWAARWLAAHGIDGAHALVLVLQKLAEGDAVALAPDTDKNPWQARQNMSPLLAGVTLMDRSALFQADTLALDEVDTPIFLAPFCAELAKLWQSPLLVRSTDATRAFSFQTDGASLWAEGELMGLANVEIVKCEIKPQSAPMGNETRARPSAADLEILNAYAARIYAPDTETSRLKGAGAGVSDND